MTVGTTVQEKTMTVAVIGVGGHGLNAAVGLRSADEVSEVICVDTCEKRVGELQNKGFVATTDLETILQDRNVGLVFITAGNYAHAPLTLQALQAGKAVMCEKPMATTLSDAQAMVEESERRGVFLQIGFELRYSHAYTTIKDWIDAGLLGEVVNTNCFYQTSENPGKSSWRISPETGGNMFQEKLCHYVDLPRWWVGSDVTDVYSVCAPNIVPYFKIRDNYHTTYRFASGAVSHLTFNMGIAETFAGDPLQDMLEQQKDDGHALQYLVTGTKGAAWVDVFRRVLRRWEFGDSPERMTSKVVEEQLWTDDDDHCYIHNTGDQNIDIVRRVLAGEPPKTPARDAFDTMRLVFAADRSADLGQVVCLSDLEEAF